MIKVVTLLTRKPGMSREAFIEHYETHHRKIGEHSEWLCCEVSAALPSVSRLSEVKRVRRCLSMC